MSALDALERHLAEELTQSAELAHLKDEHWVVISSDPLMVVTVAGDDPTHRTIPVCVQYLLDNYPYNALSAMIELHMLQVSHQVAVGL